MQHRTFQCTGGVYQSPALLVADSRMCILSLAVQIRYPVGLFLMTNVPCMSLPRSITNLHAGREGGV